MRIDNPTFIGDENKFNGSFTGSFQGTGSALVGVPFGDLSGKPEIVSSSNQIASQISGSLGPNASLIRGLTGASITGSSDFLSSSLAVRLRNVEERNVDGFPFTGSAEILGSMNVSGPVTASYFKGDGSQLSNIVPENYQQIDVLVVSNKYQIDGRLAPELSFFRGTKYRFDTSDPSCEFHAVSFVDASGTSYTDGVTTVGTAGSSGSYTDIEVSYNAPSIIRYRSNTAGQSYGNRVAIFDLFEPIFPNGAEITGSVSVSERLGIGVGIPLHEIHIKSTADADIVIEADTDDVDENHNPLLRLSQDNSTRIAELGMIGTATPYVGAKNDAVYLGTTTIGPLQLITNDNARVTIQSDGKIGIGTNTPTSGAAVQIVGTVSASAFVGDGSGLINLQTGSGGGGVSDYTELTNVPSNILSSSAQVENLGFITSSIATNFPQNTVSSSAQVTAFLPANVVSSSAQVDYNSIQNQPTIPVVEYSSSFQNLNVTVSGFQYNIDGVARPKLTLQKGHTYRFDLSDSSNGGHPFAFRLRDGSTSYTTGVIQNGTAGNAGAYTQIHVKQDTPTQLIYYCTVHGNGMGNSVIVQSAFNTIFEDNMTITGSLTVTGNVSAANISDERVKDNLTPISQPLDKLGEIQGYEFDWIPTEGVTSDEGHDLGVVAQEIEKIAPEAVVTRDNGYKSVKYDRLIPILIQSIKELTERVKVLENK